MGSEFNPLTAFIERDLRKGLVFLSDVYCGRKYKSINFLLEIIHVNNIFIIGKGEKNWQCPGIKSNFCEEVGTELLTYFPTLFSTSEDETIIWIYH